MDDESMYGVDEFDTDDRDEFFFYWNRKKKWKWKCVRVFMWYEIDVVSNDKQKQCEIKRV